MIKCCFTHTETVGLLGTGAQDIHLDSHTAPELCCDYVHRNCRFIRDGSPGPFCFTSTEARWLIRNGDGVRGGGRRGGTKEWKLDRGYRPKKTGETVDRRRSNGNVKVVSPRHCPATSALSKCCLNCRAGQSHKDNVRCTAVEQQFEAKEVQLSHPSSTSLLMISSGQTWRSSSTSLL